MWKLFSAVWLFLEYCSPVTFSGIFYLKISVQTETGANPLEADLTYSQLITSSISINKLLEKREDVHLLMACYIKHKDPLEKPHLTKKEVFEKIAAEFNHISDVVVRVDQCFCKGKKMETEQKKIEDNAKTEREKKTWKFHREMEECLANNSSVRPVLTYETSGSSLSTSTSANVSVSGSEGTEKGYSSQNVPQEKRLRRKSKLQSSAAKMIDFLKVYSDKRGKVEEEKVKI